jgi:hypothetical protein
MIVALSIEVQLRKRLSLNLCVYEDARVSM